MWRQKPPSLNRVKARKMGKIIIYFYISCEKCNVGTFKSHSKLPLLREHFKTHPLNRNSLYLPDTAVAPRGIFVPTPHPNPILAPSQYPQVLKTCFFSLTEFHDTLIGKEIKSFRQITQCTSFSTITLIYVLRLFTNKTI